MQPCKAGWLVCLRAFLDTTQAAPPHTQTRAHAPHTHCIHSPGPKALPGGAATRLCCGLHCWHTHTHTRTLTHTHSHTSNECLDTHTHTHTHAITPSHSHSCCPPRCPPAPSVGGDVHVPRAVAPRSHRIGWEVTSLRQSWMHKARSQDTKKLSLSAQRVCTTQKQAVMHDMHTRLREQTHTRTRPTHMACRAMRPRTQRRDKTLPLDAGRCQPRA
jgi:hypothetical protein